MPSSFQLREGPGGSAHGSLEGGAARAPALSSPGEPLEFDVLAEIAAGTTARIELCRLRAPAARAGSLVAVKRLHKHIAEDREFANMFFDEVWMTAALRHPNVVEVAGWGNDREGTFFAVELVQGVSLARLMKTVFETGEKFSERMVVYLGSEICSGLAAAHGLRGQNGELLQLVHRDLTPGNVLIGFNGQIKITDFGLAKAKQRVTKTMTGLLKGHPQYMAPEMAHGFEIDSRADLFSLGVVLFELFAGEHPWSGQNEIEILRVSATEPPKDLMALRPKLDKELGNVVARLLEKDPTKRFQHADEVRARLLAWLDAHGYAEGNDEALGRFVRRNAMRQMRWFERAVSGELLPHPFTGENPVAKRPMTSGSKPPRAERGGADRGSPEKGKAVPPPPRLRRHRKPAEGPSDVADLSAKDDDLATTRPGGRGEAVDWGEEIPTVVKKTDPSSFLPPPKAYALADEDSDGRTTQNRNTNDPSAEDVPTVPVPKAKAQAAIAQALAQRQAGQGALAPLPPPPPADRRPQVIPALPPPPQSNEAPRTRGYEPAARPPTVKSAPAPAPPEALRTGDDLLDEADRLAVEAVRLRDEADAAAETAAHAALLAQLAHDAAALAAEAVRARSQGAHAKADLLLQDAHKLEETLLKQSAAPGGMLATSHAPRGGAWEERVSDPPPAPEPPPRPPIAPSLSAPPPAPPPFVAPISMSQPPPAYTPSVPPPAPPPPVYGARIAPAAEAHGDRGPARISRRAPPPNLLDQKLWGIRISTAIAFVAAFVFAVLILIVAVSR